MLRTEARIIDVPIRSRRLTLDEMMAATRIAKASRLVDRDRASELSAGLTPKVLAKAGSRGWTQYSREKVAKPARKSARLARR